MSLVSLPVVPPAPSFQLVVETTARTTRLVVSGEIDTLTAPELRRAIEAAVQAGARQVVVDLCAVTFLDSAGLCALAAGHRGASAAGAGVRLTCSTRAVVRVLETTGLWDVLGAERVPA